MKEQSVELEYYQSICQIQEKCINGDISKSECEQKIEIERLKFIEYLRKRNEALMISEIHQQQNSNIINAINSDRKS
jgi:hypothetical protein